jgi:hypothetical protein
VTVTRVTIGYALWNTENYNCGALRPGTTTDLSVSHSIIFTPRCIGVLSMCSKAPFWLWYFQSSHSLSAGLTATSAQTCLYVFVTFNDTQDLSPSSPAYSEWDICWPVATWYISWHVLICLSVVSLPSRLFTLGCDVPRFPTIQVG